MICYDFQIPLLRDVQLNARNSCYGQYELKGIVCKELSAIFIIWMFLQTKYEDLVPLYMLPYFEKMLPIPF